MESRKLEEIAFHDRLREGEGAHAQRWSREAERQLAGNPLWANFKYYSIEAHGLEFIKQQQLRHVADAVVLDYCCGNGDDAVFLAKSGAKEVHGIDISEVSIANCKTQARQAGVESKCHFQTMDAESLKFPDNTFDVITEYGVLHHLDLPVAMSELARVLKPGGVMICTETLAHNPLIRWYRRRTPELRTAWEAEHILGYREFRVIDRFFASRESRFFHMATLLAVPLRHTPLFNPMLALLRAVDGVLLRIPGLRWYAWQGVFVLRKPVKR